MSNQKSISVRFSWHHIASYMVLVLALIMFCTVPAWAQTDTARLRGMVFI